MIVSAICLAPTALTQTEAWGNAPGFREAKTSSAESAIHRLQLAGEMNRAFSAAVSDRYKSWGVALGFSLNTRLWRKTRTGVQLRWAHGLQV
jgi:hypothetical protein